MNELEGFRDRGVRAFVLLHERALRTCLVSWRRALAWGVELPATGQHGASPQASFRTVLRDVPRERLRESDPTNWVPALVVEAMLERAVVHPMRHALQLEGLMTPS